MTKTRIDFSHPIETLLGATAGISHFHTSLGVYVETELWSGYIDDFGHSKVFDRPLIRNVKAKPAIDWSKPIATNYKDSPAKLVGYHRDGRKIIEWTDRGGTTRIAYANVDGTFNGNEWHTRVINVKPAPIPTNLRPVANDNEQLDIMFDDGTSARYQRVA